jgi:DNA-binding MarR family transcriptional regulator
MSIKVCLAGNEEHKLRLLRRIFDLRKDDVTRNLRKLCSEELHNFCPVPTVSMLKKCRRMC